MKRINLLLVCIIATLCAFAQNKSFGKVTLVPYVQPSDILDNQCQQLLTTKLIKIAAAYQVSGGFDRRFLIVPRIDILEEEETSTTPQKTVMQVMFTFSVGDGVSGALFNNLSIETKGVGNSHFDALYSAIKKIQVNDSDFFDLIKIAQKRILAYYNEEKPTMVAEARNCMVLQKYENAIYILSLIPEACDDYDEIQKLITECCHAILIRNNQKFLQNAKLAWAASPNVEGAKVAIQNLQQIIILDDEDRIAISNLTNTIQERMVEMQNKEYEIKIQELAVQKAQIESAERIRIEEIQAGERETESFYQMLPGLVYNIASWII